MARKTETEGEPASAADRARKEACEESAFVTQIGAQLSELKQQLAELWAIKVAEIKLSIFNKLFATVAGALAAIFVAAILCVAAYFVLAGVAEALSNAWSSRALGLAATGTLAMIVIGLVLFGVKKGMTSSASKKARRKEHDER